jgi:hypothetical protein
VIQATAAQIMMQFANNLKAQIGSSAAPVAAAGSPAAGAPPQAASAPVAPPPIPPAKPISGFSLMAKVIWSAIVRLFTGRPPAG